MSTRAVNPDIIGRALAKQIAQSTPPVQAPLLPLWHITYTHVSGTGQLWLRAPSVVDALAETRRLHPHMYTATILPWLDTGEEVSR